MQSLPLSYVVRSQVVGLSGGGRMEDGRRSWQELRAILADPGSKPEQVIQAKLTAARRIADGPNITRQICSKYGLAPEQAAEMMAGHLERMGELEAWSGQEVQRLERLLAQLRRSSEAEPPAT